MTRRDWAGLALVLLALAALVLFRKAVVEPREWGALCAAAQAPGICAPRAGLLWLQHYQLWGLGGLGLGLLAFLTGRLPLAAAAVGLGAAAVANYNATWGMIGLALGAWAWIRRAREAGPAGAG